MNREERNKYAREWYCANRDKVLERNRTKIMTDEQRELKNKNSRKYYASHKEQHKILTQRYKEEHRGNKKRKIRVYDKEKRLNEKEYKRAYNKEWRKHNPELAKEQDRNSYQRKKLKVKQRYIEIKSNPELKEIYNKKYRQRIAKKKEIDPVFKLSRDIPNLIRISIKRYGYSKRSKTYSILGCTYEELKKHLESKFEPWMNWNNRGKYNGELQYGWDVDHIIPVSIATTTEEIIKLNHYTNLQPLDSFVNRHVKRNKVA